MVTLYLTFWGASECFPRQLRHLTFPPAAEEASSFATSLSTLIIAFLMIAVLVAVTWSLTVVLMCVFLVTNDVLVVYLYISTFVKWHVFGHFFIVLFTFLLSCNDSLYILDITSLLDIMNIQSTFWLQEITENLATVVVSIHNQNKIIWFPIKQVQFSMG